MSRRGTSVVACVCLCVALLGRGTDSAFSKGQAKPKAQEDAVLGLGPAKDYVHPGSAPYTRFTSYNNPDTRVLTFAAGKPSTQSFHTLAPIKPSTQSFHTLARTCTH